MRYLFIFLLFSVQVYGRSFYVSNQGNAANSGMSPEKAWSYAYLQQVVQGNTATKLQGGDTVLLQAAQTYYGGLTIRSSGHPENPIVFGSFGKGAKPVISGWVRPDGWQLQGKHVFTITIGTPPAGVLNLVALDNRVVGKGRYPNENTPNKGYLTVDDATADASSITNEMLAQSSINWTGAAIVARLSHFILDTATILSQSGGTIHTRAFGKKPPKGFGFFITNDPRTLDKRGEWFYDPQTRKFSIYLDQPPVHHDIRIAGIDTLVNLGTQGFVVLQDIKLTGANKVAVSLQGCPGITITRCDITEIGMDAIAAGHQRNVNLAVTHNRISDCGDLAIGARFVKSGLNIQENTISRIGLLEQHGTYNVMGRMGIYNAAGTNHEIAYNRVDSIGTAGIRFSGSNINVHHNLVQNFALVLHDCGGIYTGNASRSKLTNRKVYRNIILNAVGATAGTNGTNQASGIYSDDASHNLDIFDNIIAHGGDAGIYLHNNWNIRVYNNLVFDFADVAAQIVYDNGKWDPPYGISFTGNTLVAKDPKALLLKLLDYRDSTAIPSVVALRNYDNGTAGCTIDSNIYARPANEQGKKIYVGWHIYQKGLQQIRQYATPQFSSVFGFDAASKGAPATVRTGGREDPFLFLYNAGKENLQATLRANYVGMDGKRYSAGRLTLPPFSGLLLLQQ